MTWKRIKEQGKAGGMHHPGGLDPADEELDQHAFIMLGKEALFLCHMTMFDHEEHCHQFAFRAKISDAAMNAYRSALGTSRPVNGGYWDKTLFLASSAKDLLNIPQLQSGYRRAFLADMYQGVPDQPKDLGWPWSDQVRKSYLVMEDVVVWIERIVFSRHFDFALERPRKLSYVLFGEGSEAHMTNFQVTPPDFDHVVTLKGAPSWLPKRKLEAGVPVQFDKDSQPSGRPVNCQDPLPPGPYRVKYAGQGHANYEVEIASTWWFSTRILNPADPCATGQGGGHHGRP